MKSSSLTHTCSSKCLLVTGIVLSTSQYGLKDPHSYLGRCLSQLWQLHQCHGQGAQPTDVYSSVWRLGVQLTVPTGRVLVRALPGEWTTPQRCFSHGRESDLSFPPYTDTHRIVVAPPSPPGNPITLKPHLHIPAGD